MKSKLEVKPETLEELGFIRVELSFIHPQLTEAKKVYEELSHKFMKLVHRRDEIERQLTEITLVIPKSKKEKKYNMDQMLERFDLLPVDLQTKLIEKLAGKLGV